MHLGSLKFGGHHILFRPQRVCGQVGEASKGMKREISKKKWHPEPTAAPQRTLRGKESTGSRAILGSLSSDFLTPLTSCKTVKSLFSERFVLVFQKSLLETGTMWSSTSIGQDSGNKARKASYRTRIQMGMDPCCEGSPGSWGDGSNPTPGS